MQQQGVLALVRDSDPQSSREGAKRARTNSQKATILRWLEAWDWAPGTIDADQLHFRFPETQRSVWSTRLSAMNRAGLLSCDRDANPVVFRLTEAGRKAARS